MSRTKIASLNTRTLQYSDADDPPLDEGAGTALEGGQDSDGNNDTVHMSTMRVRMNAMRIPDVHDIEDVPPYLADDRFDGNTEPVVDGDTDTVVASAQLNAMTVDDGFDDYFSESYESRSWGDSPREDYDDLDPEVQAFIEEDIQRREGEYDPPDRVDNYCGDETRPMTTDGTSVDNGAPLYTIPADWVPFDLLQELSLASSVEVYTARMRNEDLDWHPIPSLLEGNAVTGIPSALSALGYVPVDEFRDADWLERLAIRDPAEFQRITGYRIPDRPTCVECGDCIPQARVLLCVDLDGEERQVMSLVCAKDLEPSRIRISDLLNRDLLAITADMANEAIDDVASDSTGSPPALEFPPIEFGNRMSPLVHAALNTPLPEDDEGLVHARPIRSGAHEQEQMNGCSSDGSSEDRDDERGCGCSHDHHPWACEDCGRHNTHIVERMFAMGGDVVTRYYIECHDCDTVAPFDPESRLEERIHASRVIYSSNIRRKSTPGSTQPVRSPQLQATLAAEVEINGVKAFTLFDSGSTTDSITPEFAFASKAKQITLEDQVTLQLGCVGSRSKICYGTRVPVNIFSITDEVYFDLVNLDRYDCIIGTPFMNTYGVILDFGNRVITVNGTSYPAMTMDEEKLFLQNKKETAYSKRQSRLPPRDTKPITNNKEVLSSSHRST